MKSIEVKILVPADEFEATKSLASQLKSAVTKAAPSDEYDITVMVVAAESFVP